MKVMRGYPKTDDSELVRVAREYSPAAAALRETISEILETQDDCPKPAQLKRMLELRQAPKERLRCSECGGIGYISDVYLVTVQIDDNGKRRKEVGLVNPECVPELERRVGRDRHKAQYLAEASKPCKCRSAA
jgi:hypothetical protein